MANFERDLFCRICGLLIDHHVVDEEYKNNGYLTTLLANDAMRAHQIDSRCDANQGWTPGEWSEVKDPIQKGVTS